MGCTISVEARRDMRWVDGAGPRTARSFSLLAADRQRLRSKASSVLGTLGLAHGRHSGATTSCKYTALSTVEEEMMKCENDHAAVAACDALPAEEGKRDAGPRTPTRTPTSEPEVINAWELMAGLEDDEPTPAHQQTQRPPPWMQSDSVVSIDFDPEILSGFREALADMSPSHWAAATDKRDEARKGGHSGGTPTSPSTASTDMPELSGIVRARINAFQEKILERRPSTGVRDARASPLVPPGGRRKAVVYFTSLRGVRKTFVDCCAVRSILRSYRVHVDERDVSMHAAFKAELAQLLGRRLLGSAAAAALPQVFVDGYYLGGAEDVQALHEAGELARVLEGCEPAPARKLGYMEACAACGDVRFVLCETCCGSCKVFVEDEEDDGDGEFRRCPDCNENGLIACPVCCC